MSGTATSPTSLPRLPLLGLIFRCCRSCGPHQPLLQTGQRPITARQKSTGRILAGVGLRSSDVAAMFQMQNIMASVPVVSITYGSYLCMDVGQRIAVLFRFWNRQWLVAHIYARRQGAPHLPAVGRCGCFRRRAILSPACFRAEAVPTTGCFGGFAELGFPSCCSSGGTFLRR